MLDDYRHYDVLAFLEGQGIEHWASQKNVGRGWVSIQCRFCTDHSNHLGININSNVFSCMKCGVKGGLPFLVKTILDCSWREAYEALEPYEELSTRDGGHPPPRASPRWRDKDLPIPKSFSKEFPHRFIQYLAARGFNPKRLIEKYDLYACHTMGRFRWRVIAPVIMNGRVVNFIGRDISGKAKSKYILETNEAAALPKGQILYNLDAAGDTILIVEGPADVWRIGDGAVATMGTQFSALQVKTILDHGIQRVFVLYDPEPEATRLAKRLANQLSGVIPHVDVLLKQTEGDPGDMSPDEVIELRRKVFTH